MRLTHYISVVQLLASHFVAATLLDSTLTRPIEIGAATDPVQALTQLQQHAYNALKQREGVSNSTINACPLETAIIR
jgi:tyrosinase